MPLLIRSWKQSVVHNHILMDDALRTTLSRCLAPTLLVVCTQKKENWLRTKECHGDKSEAIHCAFRGRSLIPSTIAHGDRNASLKKPSSSRSSSSISEAICDQLPVCIRVTTRDSATYQRSMHTWLSSKPVLSDPAERTNGERFGRKSVFLLWCCSCSIEGSHSVSLKPFSDMKSIDNRSRYHHVSLLFVPYFHERRDCSKSVMPNNNSNNTSTYEGDDHVHRNDECVSVLRSEQI